MGMYVLPWTEFWGSVKLPTSVGDHCMQGDLCMQGPLGLVKAKQSLCSEVPHQDWEEIGCQILHASTGVIF